MATKKTTSKKASVSKSTPRKRSNSKTVKVRSFHVAPRDRPFWSFLFTTQSFYWVLIGAAVVAVGIYVATLQIRINNLYDQVDMNSTQSLLNEKEIEMIKNSN